LKNFLQDLQNDLNDVLGYFSEIVRNVKSVGSSSEVVANLVRKIAAVVDSFQSVLETLKVEKLGTLGGGGVGPGA
jgi:methyl-accepting chemotaxis protein